MENTFTIYAQPASSGFFGLTQLHKFTADVLEPYVREDVQPTIVLDFSLVRVWDVAALLWLTIALHHYRYSSGLSFLLRLPEGKNGNSPKDLDDFDKSADYLRRWRFDSALTNIAPDPRSLLVPEQRDYFPPSGPKRFYVDRKTRDSRGLLQSLISRRLAEIKNLCNSTELGAREISPDLISDWVRRFQAERIGDVLESQCGIEKRKADLFSDHLLTEALMNVKEHPRATIGLVAISIMGNTNELVCAVADNGDSIVQTIYDRYRRDHFRDEAVIDYDAATLPSSEKAKIAHYATLEGVTRKTGEQAQGAGMGLTYIKADTVDTFGGKLRILTDSVCLKYAESSSAAPEPEEWKHSWRGNLLRISIPLDWKTWGANPQVRNVTAQQV